MQNGATQAKLLEQLRPYQRTRQGADGLDMDGLDMDGLDMDGLDMDGKMVSG
ncbi:MAG: hypothetical protein ETSY2_16205 [Candidatus Entotheonella gemina]|uniref:Uncharacterized protein n=1 Tax=Candidatus Entotheonella gemina TaxID=1429439 RepID=W4M9J0_9BACT|nr:MAG: hypothetical protein ETSY2_16205 [Candidatus Entotheonella gemina]